MTFTQTSPAISKTSALTASNLTFRLGSGSDCITTADRDAVASALESGHGSRYILLAYSLLDDSCSAILLHTAAAEISVFVTEWNSAISARMLQHSDGQWLDSLIPTSSISISNPLQIALTINELVTCSLRKPYVNDDYRWLRVMPMLDDANLPPIGFGDDWRNWARATPVPSIMKGIFTPNGEPSHQLRITDGSR